VHHSETQGGNGARTVEDSHVGEGSSLDLSEKKVVADEGVVSARKLSLLLSSSSP